MVLHVLATLRGSSWLKMREFFFVAQSHMDVINSKSRRMIDASDNWVGSTQSRTKMTGL